MALIKVGVTKCVLTGKVVEEGDSIVCFPPLEHDPNDPIAICYDACAQREAFETWKYKATLIEKISAYWQEYYNQSSAFETVFLDKSLMLIRGVYERKIRIFFLQHVFFLDIPFVTLPKLLTTLREWKGQNDCIQPLYLDVICRIQREVDTIKISLSWEKMKHQDYIRLSFKEWAHFYSVIISNGGFVR
ncbi:MAG: hypothetical protein R3E31_22250 [Chloroflexota bacterium]|nr:hypothetical protein [Anaerolineales bacterium]